MKPNVKNKKKNQGSESITEEGAERAYQLESKEDCCDMLSSGHAMALMALYKIKPISIPSRTGEGLTPPTASSKVATGA